MARAASEPQPQNQFESYLPSITYSEPESISATGLQPAPSSLKFKELLGSVKPLPLLPFAIHAGISSQSVDESLARLPLVTQPAPYRVYGSWAEVAKGKRRGFHPEDGHCL